MACQIARPLLSVLILGPREPDFFAQAVASVHAQSIDGMEILVEGTLSEARGKYIAFLQADGLFEAGALRARLEYMQAHPATQLVHGPVRLIDETGSDLGAVISRPKAIGFDAAMNPIHLSGVMGTAELLRQSSLAEGLADDWLSGWQFFAQVLRTGAVSQFVAAGGARHRIRHVPTLASEQRHHDMAICEVLGWMYAPVADGMPDYRQGLASPPFTAARRLRDFSLFIWCLLSGHAQECRAMLENAGFTAFLNTWLVVSIKDEIRLQVARHYHVNLLQAGKPAPAVAARILRDGIALGLRDKAPSVLLALCECLGAPYPVERGRPACAPDGRFDEEAGDRPFVLITTFRTGGEAGELSNCTAILLENCANPRIDQVHVLLEGAVASLENCVEGSRTGMLRAFIESGKLVFSPIAARPHYRELFDYADSLGQVVATVANADMLLPLKAVHDLVDGRSADGFPVYALTRWNRTATGEYLQGMQPHPPWPQWSPCGRIHFERHCLSYDCYVFDTPIRAPAELSSVFIATYGCDTAIAAFLRMAGHVVRNPCLSVRTLHVDEKVRDYAGERGQQDLANNLQAFARGALRTFGRDSSLGRCLQDLHMLDRRTAWLGGPGNRDLMHTVFLCLGASPWAEQGRYRPFSVITISIENGDLASAGEALARVPDAIERNLFIMWELSGFSSGGGHIADLLVDHPRFEAIGYPLFRYQWQSMVHRDQASNESQWVLDAVRDMIVTILRE